jgi:hypothetical protein
MVVKHVEEGLQTYRAIEELLNDCRLHLIHYQVFKTTQQLVCDFPSLLVMNYKACRVPSSTN